MSKFILVGALAASLTIGIASLGFARNNDDSKHDQSPHHALAGHSFNKENVATVAFNQHGGGHELATNNVALHETEMNDSGHSDKPMQSAAPSYEKHGGGHEQERNNATVHEQEIRDPKHKD